MSPARRSFPLVLALAIAACGRSAAPAGSASATAPAVASTSASAPASATASASASASASLDPVRLEQTLPGHLSIRNDRDRPLRIAWEMPIEREASGAWSLAGGMHPMAACQAPGPADGCVTIAPRSSLALRPWTGWFGCTQCGTCRANVPAQPGRYRAVAVECDGGARHEGPVMEIVDEGRLAGTPKVTAQAGAPNTLEIANRSDAPIALRTEVEVLQLDRVRGAWEAVSNADMGLGDTCVAKPPACTTVAPRSTIRTLGWRPGCGACRKCNEASLRPGTYKMRVYVCDPAKPLYDDVFGETFYGPAFTVDAKGRFSPSSD
jgi:hypothetical protein